jgi:hypothetical protein
MVSGALPDPSLVAAMAIGDMTRRGQCPSQRSQYVVAGRFGLAQGASAKPE